jgi:hypothetical protein
MISAVALSIPTWFIFPAHPTKAKFLSDHDKYLALERIRLNNTGTQNTRMFPSKGFFDMAEVLRFQERPND